MSLKARLTRLESHNTGGYGFRRDHGPVLVGGEEMTPEEFDRRYPGGEIIHIILYDGPAQPHQHETVRS